MIFLKPKILLLKNVGSPPGFRFRDSNLAHAAKNPGPETVKWKKIFVFRKINQFYKCANCVRKSSLRFRATLISAPLHITT